MRAEVAAPGASRVGRPGRSPAGTDGLPRARRLSLSEKASLGLEIVSTYLLVRRELRSRDLRDTLAALRGDPAPPAPEQLDRSKPGDWQTLAEWLRLGRVVRRSLGLLPGDTRCLTQSLVLLRLLAQRKIGSDLVIAVKPGESFGAHAWIEVTGRALLPPGEREFERLVTL